MKHVVSFSGGRTSAYLVYLMEQKRKKEGWDVDYVFMDTGAEYPKTYEFVCNVAEYFDIDLKVIKANINPVKGVGVEPLEIDVKDIGWDLSGWRAMLSKLGHPVPQGGFCTSELKTVPHNKYCNSKYGKGNYYTWMGMRCDEPKRLFSKEAWGRLSKYGMLRTEAAKVYVDSRHGDLSNWALDEKTKSLVLDSTRKRVKEGKRYLAEISTHSKDEILKFWESMPFDLEIDEWLGNCVFCIKKGVNKVALAALQEPDLAREWAEMSTGEHVLQKFEKDGTPLVKGAMYRGKLNINGVAELYAGANAEQILSTMRVRRGCAVEQGESCEVFGCQGDLFEEGTS